MYSYEDRIRAVKLFIKLGKRIAPTVRQLGYPTKNALKSWLQEYEALQDLRVVYVRPKQKYSYAQKLAAVQHYLEHDRCIASTIKALGYPCRDYLRVWIAHRYLAHWYRSGGGATGLRLWFCSLPAVHDLGERRAPQNRALCHLYRFYGAGHDAARHAEWLPAKLVGLPAFLCLDLFGGPARPGSHGLGVGPYSCGLWCPARRPPHLNPLRRNHYRFTES